MPNPPSIDVQKAFVQPTVAAIRRLEIYEEDGVTPWKPDLWDSLLMAGTISVDYDRDERRTLDVTVDNPGRELDPKAGGLWYDKVFKVFYGIRLGHSDRELRVAIVEEYNSSGQAFELKERLIESGVNEVHYMPSASTLDQVSDYDVLVAISSTSSQKVGLLTSAYNAGKSIVTFTSDQTPASMPLIVGNAGANVAVAGAERVYTPFSAVHPVAIGWTEWRTHEATSYRRILAAASGATVVAQTQDSTGQSLGVIAREDSGARWVHVSQSRFDDAIFESEDDKDDFSRFAARAVSWASTHVNLDQWETQIGEFLADSIQDTGELESLQITGRDYAKKLMVSKFPASTTFLGTVSIESVIKTVATNGQITKMKLPITNKVLDKDTTWERGTTRWEVIKDVANANNYEIFFDQEGYLVMREFRDPVLTPPSLILAGGIGGNLVSRGAKTSDSRLFNHIVVVGESSDSSVPPVSAEAINTVVGSFTNVSEIGDRVDITTSSLITDVAGAQELADTLLAVAALEEFELSFTATLLPWIEVGEVLDMSRSDDTYWGPDRYLLTSLNLPLDLTPMSGNGKRVVKVL